MAETLFASVYIETSVCQSAEKGKMMAFVGRGDHTPPKRKLVS